MWMSSGGPREPRCEWSAQDPEGNVLVCDASAHWEDEHLDLQRRVFWRISPYLGLAEVTALV